MAYHRLLLVLRTLRPKFVDKAPDCTIRHNMEMLLSIDKRSLTRVERLLEEQQKLLEGLKPENSQVAGP